MAFEPVSVAFEPVSFAIELERVARHRVGLARLLEADEVLAAIAESLQQSMSAPSENGPLSTICGAFHTLGVAGRMVGLAAFGDAGLACEQALDRWLAKDRAGTARLHRLLEPGHEYFSVGWRSCARIRRQ